MVLDLLLQAVLISSFVLVYADVRKHQAGLLFYPYLWVYILSVFYFCIPAIYAEEISYYYHWNFQQDSITLSKVLSLYLMVVVLGCYLFFRRSIAPVGKIPPLNKSQTIAVTIVGLFLLAALLFVLITQGFSAASQTFDEGYSGEASLTEDYKLKNLAYMAMPIIATLIISGRHLLPFVLTLVIVLLDAAQGGRTAAILPILTMYLSYAVRGNKLYVLTVVPVLGSVYAVGIFLRPEELLNFEAIPWQVAVLGEFRETFVTLPIIIEQRFHFNGEFQNVLLSVLYPLLGPLRSVMADVVVNPGAVMASAVGRGYGLGLNLYTESYYYFSTAGFILAPWVICIACLPFVILLRRRTKQTLVLFCLFVIFIRLSLREGILPNSGLLLYLYITLIALPMCIWWLLSVGREAVETPLAGPYAKARGLKP